MIRFFSYLFLNTSCFSSSFWLQTAANVKFRLRIATSSKPWLSQVFKCPASRSTCVNTCHVWWISCFLDQSLSGCIRVGPTVRSVRWSWPFCNGVLGLFWLLQLILRHNEYRLLWNHQMKTPHENRLGNLPMASPTAFVNSCLIRLTPLILIGRVVDKLDASSTCFHNSQARRSIITLLFW